MDGQGDDVDKRAVYVKVPVDRFARAAGTADVVLGTHLGDFNAPLPTDVGTAAGRYERVRATTRAAKAGYRVGLAASMSGVVGGLAMPTRLALIATDAKTVSCYVSNMKGPAAPMHLVGGIPVVNVRCHPLGLNNIGVGFAVYSYAGHVNVAVCTDKQLIPDPDVLCGFLEDELRELAAASLRSRVATVMPVLFPVDAAAISRFLVGTRDASLKLAADFIHHSTDYVRLDSDALPLLSALEPCGKDDGEGEGDGADHARAPMLQRDCFTVIERVPVLLGLVNQTVTVKSWQVLDPAQRVAAYEIVVQGAGVRVWKMRELEDLGGDEAGTRRTRVSETLRGVCPWVLQGVVSKDSAKTQRDAMDKYAAMIGDALKPDV
ncbi:hypothetical protein DFH09DRAFT_1174449 [Mycena vulgaris]|nr:hypothetical protein DFH09DRAFT_1174449 [Mycena vulgaris]